MLACLNEDIALLKGQWICIVNSSESVYMFIM